VGISPITIPSIRYWESPFFLKKVIKRKGNIPIKGNAAIRLRTAKDKVMEQPEMKERKANLFV
tara:strand:- start:172 stop:360 length:189 start_codon:yes stop_codon:yes gene_type:complete